MENSWSRTNIRLRAGGKRGGGGSKGPGFIMNNREISTNTVNKRHSERGKRASTKTGRDTVGVREGRKVKKANVIAILKDDKAEGDIGTSTNNRLSRRRIMRLAGEAIGEFERKDTTGGAFINTSTRNKNSKIRISNDITGGANRGRLGGGEKR